MKHLIFCILFFNAILCVSAQNLLDPKTQPKFINPLPIPSVIDVTSGGRFTMSIGQFNQKLGLIDPATKQPLLTTVWGYNGTYPGPTILAKRDKAIDITWENNLISNSKPLPHLLPVDTSIDWALSGRNDWEKLGVPIVTHVHGGHTESASDGLPNAWFTPLFKLKGADFVKQTYHYDNDQEAATIWYHDHALGITRLNVYAGLAGYYIITDDNEKKLQKENKIPSGPYDIGLAIQDRMFTRHGQLYYPSLPASLGVPEESISPEFFGDFILVNGASWPVLEVEPRPYRFRVLNGSDSRFYNLHLSNGQSIIQIASDDGLLPAPVNFSHLLIGTGERKDIIIDFSKYPGQTIIVQNNAKTPYPKGSTVDPVTSGQIMAFKVVKPLSTYPKAVLPATLRPSINRLQTSLPARKLIMFESEDEYNRLEVLLGTYEKGAMDFHDPVTEKPALNSTEVWELYNETPDAHTIHLHLVHMQLISRQKFKASVDLENGELGEETGKPKNVRLIGQPRGPGPDEIGWKDTYIMYPGEVTRVIATFDRPGLYVWHCHILSHEDHEMMRPYYVTSENRKQVTDVATNSPIKQLLQLKTLPNPFNGNLTVQLNLPQSANVIINLYDSKGSRIQQVYSGAGNAGMQQFNINGTNLSKGTYFCEVIVDNQRLMRKLVLLK